MLLLVSLLVAVCVLLAGWRLRAVLTVNHFDLDARFFESPRPNLASFEPAPPRSFENALWAAWEQHERRLSVAVLEQALEESLYSLARYRRMPRTAARISSTLGFLVAAMSFRAKMSELGEGAVFDNEATLALVLSAAGAVAIAMAGSMLCVSLGQEANRAEKREVARVETWIAQLEAHIR